MGGGKRRAPPAKNFWRGITAAQRRPNETQLYLMHGGWQRLLEMKEGKRCKKS